MPQALPRVSRRLRLALLALPLIALPFGCVKAPDVDFTVPADGSSGVDASTEITVAFTSALDPETATEVANFIVTGSVSGPHATAATLDETSKILTIVPTTPFSSGETVTVSLTSRITTSISVALEEYQFSFRIAGVSASIDSFDDTTGQFLLASLDPQNNSVAVSQRPVIRAEFQAGLPGEEAPIGVFVDTATAENVQMRGGLTGVRGSQVSVASVGAPGENQTAAEVLIQLASSEPLFEPGEQITVTYGLGLQAPGEELTDPALSLRPYVASFEARSGEVTGGFSEALPLTISGSSPDSPAVQAIFADLLPTEGPELLVLEESGNVVAYARFSGAPYTEVATLAVGPVVAIAAADFESAGRSDLLVLHSNGTIEQYALAGTSFQQIGEPIFTAGTQPRDLEVADLNGDGFLDLVVAVAEGVEFFQKNPSVEQVVTGFTRIEGDPLVDPVFDLAVGDLDGDGRTDVVAEASSGVVVLRNAGAFLFASVSMLSITPIRGSLEVADFDGDGNADVIAGGSGGVFVHFGSGGAIPAPIWAPTTFPLGAGVQPTQIAVGNFDGDLNHLPDLIWYDADAPTPLGLLSADQPGAIREIKPFDLPVEAPLGGFALADVNRDGARDVLAYGRGVGGDPTFLLATTVDVVGGGESSYSLAMTGPATATLGAGSITLAVAADIGEQVSGFTLALAHDPGFRLEGVTLDEGSFPAGGATVSTLMGDGTALITVDLGASFLMAGEGISLLDIEIDLVSIEPGNYVFALVDEVTLSNDETGSTEFRLEGGGVGIPDLSFAEVDLAVGSSVTPIENLVCSLAGGTPMLMWEIPDGEVYDAIRIRRNGVLLGDIAGSATAYEDNGSGGGGVYTVAGVRNGLSSLPLSCEPPAVFGTLTCMRLPINPQNIRVSWNASATYATITVRRDGAVVSTLPGTATAFTDFTGDTESHFYQVTGTTSGGETSSPAVCPDGAVPDSGTLSEQTLVPVELVQLSVDQAIATVTWANGESYDSITIVRNTPETGDEEVATLEGSAISFTEPDLPPATYTYRVRGNEAEFVGQFVSSNTVQSGPPSPAEVTCSLAAGNRVLVSWTSPFPYTAIVIERNGPDGIQLIPVPSPAQNTLLDEGVPDGVYSYTVIGTAEGVESRSAACTIEVRNLLRISDFTSTPGHRGKIRIEGQILEAVSGYSMAFTYDSTQLILSNVAIPGASVPPSVTDEASGVGGLRVLTIEIDAAGAPIFEAGVDRIFAEIVAESLAAANAVGSSNLNFTEAILTLASDGTTLRPTVTGGNVEVVPNAVFFDPTTTVVGGVIEGYIYGSFDIGLSGYQVAMTFDPALITVEEITEAGTIAAAGGTFFGSVIDNDFGGVFLGGVNVDPNPDGSIPFPAQVRAPLAFIRMQISPLASSTVTPLIFESWVGENGASQELQFVDASGTNASPTGLTGEITVVEITDPPELTQIDPTIGPSHGGMQVFITGENFFGNAGVFFGDNPAFATVLSSTEIIATSPPGFEGTVPVTVTTQLGSATLPAAYTYEPLEVFGISPGTAASCDATPLLLEGKGFFDTLEVRFGEALGTVIQVGTDGSFAVVSPPDFAQASPTGTFVVDVTVTDPVSSESIVLPNAVEYTTQFVRGDINGDGVVDGEDVTAFAAALAGTQQMPANIDAADTNDDGVVHSGDLIYLNAFVNGTGPQPPAPFPNAGDDETPDGIGNCSTASSLNPLK